MVGPEAFEPDITDWLGWAINRPAGWLARFWLDAIADDWKAAGDAWPGLPLATRAELERLLSGSDARAVVAEIVFASLKQAGILVKNLHHSSELLSDCLRVTVGTVEQNTRFVATLSDSVTKINANLVHE